MDINVKLTETACSISSTYNRDRSLQMRAQEMLSSGH